MACPFRSSPVNRVGYANANISISESVSARYGVSYQDRHLPANLRSARTLIVWPPIKPATTVSAARPATPLAAPVASHGWPRCPDAPM
jgi:hypothetical protein